MNQGNSASGRLKASLEDAKAGRVTRHDSVESLMQWLDAWPFVSLGEVCKTTSGGTPSRKNPDYFSGPIPWVKSGELPDGLVFDVEESISEEALRESSAKLFPAGTLLIALYGATVGKLGILTKPAATNQAVCAIFPPPEIDTKFLFWFLQLKRGDLIAQAVGGAQPNISQGIIRGVEIPMPPLDQQKRIVAEIEKQFSRLDEAVANLKRVKANLKRYKAAVLKAAVEGKLTEAWRKQHPDTEPASALLQRILAERRTKWEQAELAKMQAKGKTPKDDAWKKKYPEPAAPDTTDLPELPDGWVWATTSQVLNEVKDGTHETPKYRESGVPFITQKHVKSAGFVFKDYKLISPEDHQHFYKRSNPEQGDILVSMIGVNRGESCVIDTDEIFSIKNVGLLKPDHNSSDLKFIQYYLSSLLGQRLLLQRSKGGAQPFIGLTELRNWPIPLPPLAEQRHIVSEIERRLSLADALETEDQANLKRAGRLRQSVLAAEFSPLQSRSAMESQA